MKCDWRTEKLGYLYRKVLTGNFAEPIAGGWQVGGGSEVEPLWRGEIYKAHIRARSNYCVLGGCLLSLILCKSGFQDLLRVRPSSLFMLCGCISVSVGSLMRHSMYLVFAESSLVSCNLMMWSWLKLCSAIADLSG
jgi:hypothetical protein